MRPAPSVVLLTTLIGLGQGLAVVLVAVEAWTAVDSQLLASGGMWALLATLGGLLASFFHLGRPERAWRTAAMWRSSWLSREVIALPLFITALAAWTGAQLWGGWGLPGWVQALLSGAVLLGAALLWACTAMVYASVRFLKEWASPYTLLNFPLLGLASGTQAAAAGAGVALPAGSALPPALAASAMLLTLLAGAARLASLRRNARLRPRSSLQSATGIAHPVIRQQAMGFTGGAYNTREFFHGCSAATMRRVERGFMLTAFALPLPLWALAIATRAPGWAFAAFGLHLGGLLAERWYFLAQAEHPQNLYYQTAT